MKHNEYWKRREDEALKHYIADEKAYNKEIMRIYADMLDSCNEQINAFYGKYAKAERITLAEAKKRVSKLDIAAYERKAKRYVKDKEFSTQANEEMRLYNAAMKINRLEMLKANIGLELVAGHDELEKFMGDVLQGRTEAELKRQAGILGKSITNNAQTAHAIVNASFHNATFSDRVWMYHDIMKADLDKMLKTGLIQGKNPRVLARELEKYVLGDAKGGARFNAERLMRTELARVQTEAQKQSFERNGFEQYTFLANSGCCDLCKDKDGDHFKVKDMMPGENAAPLHPNCRCSVAAYEDSDEYEAWLDFLEKGGTTEEYNRLKEEEKQYLRNNLPKAYKDTRSVGAVISEQELAEIMKFAESKGVQIGHAGNVTGGFETYCGDVKVLKEVIEELSRQQNSPLYKKSGAKNAILCYDNVLGYKGDLSKIDIGAFAVTKGKTITLNKFMFDDSGFLLKEYQKAAEDGYFVRGTSYKNIIAHECGHIIEKNSKGLSSKILEIVKQEAEKNNVSTETYIITNISTYAADLNEINEYHELTAELNSLLTSFGNDVIIQSLRRDGVL